jgi:hypothetical protein
LNAKGKREVPEDAIFRVDGIRVGSWISDDIEKGGPGCLVSEQVPAKFDCYLRILHPAFDSSGRDVPWAEVASRTGRVVHPRVQWHCLVGSTDPDIPTSSLWQGHRPYLGELPYSQLDGLCEILSRHTSDADERCFFGISTTLDYPSLPESHEPLLELPDREFAVISGPLSAAGSLGIEVPGGEVEQAPQKSTLRYLTGAMGQPPNLIWPPDQKWYVCSEIDFDSTLIGCTHELASEIVQSDNLESLFVRPGDSLCADGDDVNC